MNGLTKGFYGKFFRSSRFLFRLFTRKQRVIDKENMLSPVIYVSHHQNLYGPLAIMAWFQKPVRILVYFAFFEQNSCYRQFMDYTFTERLGWNHQVAACIAKPVSYYISRLIRSMGAIPVYRGTRQVLDTIEASEAALLRGESLLLFPDVDYTNSSGEMGKMYKGFLHLEKYYYKSTGKHISFVPLYVSKKMRRIITGDAIHFGRQEDFKQEKERVYHEIHTSINRMAQACGDIPGANELPAADFCDQPLREQTSPSSLAKEISSPSDGQMIG